MASIDQAAIMWSITIIAIGVGFTLYLDNAETYSIPVQTTNIKPTEDKWTAMTEADMVQKLTVDAVALYDEKHKDAFSLITFSPKFHVGNLYVFILDEQGFRIAHGGNPDLVGLQAPNYPDNPVRDIILDNADTHGKWISYDRALPNTHIVETKHSFIIKHDGLIFGSGYYVENEHETQLRQNAQYMVEQAIADYNTHSVQAFSNFNSDSKYHDGELYVFVIRMSDDVFVAHGTNHDLIGTKDTDIFDTDGINLGDLLSDSVTPEGVWVTYSWENPVDNKVEQKTSWIKSFDGYLFGVGVYSQ